jgi:hypothetical protein
LVVPEVLLHLYLVPEPQVQQEMVDILLLVMEAE